MVESFKARMNRAEAPEKESANWQNRIEDLKRRYHRGESQGYFGPGGEAIKKVQGGSSREIRDLRRADKEAIVEVGTGAGATVEKDQELVTDKIAGCIGVFLSGPETNTLIHCTPGTAFAHTAPEYTAQQITGMMSEQGIDMKEIQATIVGTLGHASGKFSYDKEWARWEAMEAALRDQGISETKIVEVPVIDMTLYYSPEKPDELTAIGRRASYTESGNYKVENSKIDDYQISLDSKEEQDFGIVRPDWEEVERQKRAKIKQMEDEYRERFGEDPPDFEPGKPYKPSILIKFDD